MTPKSKLRLRLRHRVARLLYRLALLLSVLSLAGCAWARATFSDPPGPIVPNWDTADQAGNATENQRGIFGASRPRDAGEDG